MAVTFQEHRLGSLTSLGSQVTLAATYTINIWVKNVTLPSQEWSNLYLQNSGYKYVLDANYGAIGTGTAPRLAAGASSPLQVADTWHLVSAVYNGSTMEYYVNGASIGSITPASPPSVIDVLNGPAGQEFAAEVKDMRVYSGVATAGEILVSFNNGDGILAAAPVTYDVTVFQSDSYGDGWNSGNLTISDSNAVLVQTFNGPASGVKAPAGLSETVALEADTYSYNITPGDWPAEIVIVITDENGVTLANLVGDSPAGTFTISAPAASITPTTSVSGAAITVSATVNAVATAEGAANWSASLTAFGAIGATIDGAKALTAIGVDAALTAPSGGSHTAYTAVVDAAGVILAKADTSVDIFISQLSVGDDIIIMSYLEHPNLSPAGTHDQLTDDDGNLKWGPFYIGDLTIKSLSISSQDGDEIITDVTFDDGSGGDLNLGALVKELIKKYDLNLLSGVQSGDGTFFQSVIDDTAGINAYDLLSWEAEGTSTIMLPSGGGHYAEYDAMLLGIQITEVPPGVGSTAGPNGNSFVGIIAPGEEAPAQDSGSSSNVDARNLPSTSVSGNQVARWLFEDDYIDDTSGGSAFEFGVVGSPSFVDGKHAGTKAVQIDQGDYFTFPSTLSAASVTGWSFAFWVKEDGLGTQTSGPYGYEGNFMTDSTAVGQSHTGLNLPHANSYTMWDCDSVNDGGAQRLSTNAITFADFTDWVHVVATKDKASGLMKLYKNGVLVSSGTRIANLPSITTAFKFGYGWAGIIDSIEIYNIALSDAEALEVYDASAPQASSYDPFHGGNLSNIVKFCRGASASGAASYGYAKKEDDDSATLYFATDMTSWATFGSYDAAASSIVGSPICMEYGPNGKVFVGTSAGKIYQVDLDGNSVPISFDSLYTMPGAEQINTVKYGVTSGEWIFEAGGKMYTIPVGGNAATERYTLPAGAKCVDIAEADDGIAMILRKSDFTLEPRFALAEWANIVGPAGMSAAMSGLNATDLNYSYALDKWVASAADGTILTTADLVTFLSS